MPDEGPRRLAADAVGTPTFAVPAEPAAAEVFALSSHHRARDALAFGLPIAEQGFNIFVVGEDRTGRMTATLERLEAHAATLPRPPDWVYLNNFRRSTRPKPYRLPAGAGRRFHGRMAAVLVEVRRVLKGAFDTPAINRLLQRQSHMAHQAFEEEFARLHEFAAERGVELERGEKGVSVVPGPGTEPSEIAKLSEDERAARALAFEEVRDRISAYRRAIRDKEVAYAGELDQLRRVAAADAIAPTLDALAAEFGVYVGLARWLVELRADILDNLDLFSSPAAQADDDDRPPRQTPEERYAVNLFVDHGDDLHPLVVVEPNPTYENLFGRIEYRSGGGFAEADFALIRPGALHRANGGVLVLRAEAVAKNAEAWRFLKDALRDLCIRIEERHREGGVPMAGAPHPKPIRLSIKVVIVGAPRWYYNFFSGDPDFTTYFKIKADIDPDLPAEPENLAVYASLVRAMAARRGREIEEAAMLRLLGEASRWAGNRHKLSARFELVEDVLIEAAQLADRGRRGSPPITLEHVCRALDERRRRDARVEDRTLEAIRDGFVHIETKGSRVGQTNALVVRDQGDHAFGMPARVSARVFVGRHGIVNIERSTELGGPLQQKGVLIIAGYLSGRFARDFPLSFGASLTFEQSYGGVEGDSASMAELATLLSALAEVPLRQDIAITGSVSQMGDAQSVGGCHLKIEGFYRLCRSRGLTGEQGVLLPAANEPSIVLGDAVAADIAAGRFHIWTMRNIDDALRLLTGRPAEEIHACAAATLERYDKLMRERASLWQ